jgi:hypothetical protein
MIENHPDQPGRIKQAYELCFSRPPREEEQNLAEEFFGAEPDSLELWTQYAQVLLAANELMFID